MTSEQKIRRNANNWWIKLNKKEREILVLEYFPNFDVQFSIKSMWIIDIIYKNTHSPENYLITT